ncbi:MAG: hypothetical protein ACUVWR_15970 [Anaerolineae bacterium]
MILHGPLSLADWLGDLVVYRNLQPVDANLPGLKDIAPQLGLAGAPTPRKAELDYARVVVAILDSAARLDGREPKMQRLVALGDTRLDVSAFRNLCQVTGWRGQAFICAERMNEPAKMEEAEAGVCLANRWAMVGDLPEALRQRSFPVDENTVIMVDLDKTAIGARGRNDHIIDQARIEGVRRTAAALLGDTYDEERFLVAYYKLNQPSFHPFTADNQDYLVYICLIIAAGLRRLDDVVAEVQNGRLHSFSQFIEAAHSRYSELAGSPLAAVHAAVYERFRAGDPTPFKAFRYNEFRATIERLGCLPGTPSIEEALAKEIVITHEVAQIAQYWRQCGALVFGISDKPDEAALPTDEDEAAGYVPLHRGRTHCVGEEIL